MNSSHRPAANAYFPAIVRSEHDSPLDALVAACVPRHEAMDLLAASWADGNSDCLLAILDGGRPVVVLPTPVGRWAACNALLGDLCTTPQQAARQLRKRLSPQRRGYVASLPTSRIPAAQTQQLSSCPCRPRQSSGLAGNTDILAADDSGQQ